ncbi:MAG: helix-turn-helix domain-containing protein [Candidatus Thorarchaeota archaeon]
MSAPTKLGLSDKEFGAYLLLASLGPLTEGEIAGLLQISYEDAKAIVSNLEKNKLAFIQKGIIDKACAILPTKELHETLETFAADVQALVDTVTNQVKEGQSQLNTSAEELHNVKDSTLQTIGQSFEALVSQIEKETEESLSKGNQARATFLQNAKTSISQATEAVYQELASNLAETQQGLTDLIEKNKTLISASSEENLKELQSKLQADQDYVQSSFTGAKESVSLVLGEEKSSIDSNVKNFEEAGGMMLNGWTAEIENTFSSFQEEASKATSSFSANVASKLDESEAIIDDATITTEQGFKETLTTSKDGVASAISQSRGSALELFSGAKTAITEELTSQKATTEQSQADSLAKMNETISTDLAESKTGLEELRSQISVEFGQHDTHSQNLLTESRTSIAESCETTLSTLTESTTNLETDLKSKATEYSEELSRIVASETEKTTETFQSAISEMVANLQTLEQTLAEEVNSWRSKVEENAQSFASNSLTAFNQGTQEIGTQVTELIQGIQASVTQAVTEIANGLSNTTISLKKQIDDTFLQTNQMVETVSSKILAGGEEAIAVLTTTGSALGNLVENIQTTVDQAQENLTTSLETIQTQLFEELDKVIQNSAEKMAESRRQTAEKISALKGEQTTVFDTMMTELEATTSRTKEESTKSGASLRETLQQTIASSLADVEQKTTQSSEVITSRLDEQSNEFLTQRNQLTEELRASISNLQNQVNTTTDESGAAILQRINQGIEANKEKLDSGAATVVAGTSGLVSELESSEQGHITQVGQAIQATTQQTQETIHQNLTEMGSTIEKAFGTANEIIDTHVITPLREIVNEKAVGESQDIAAVLKTLTTELGKLTVREPTTQLIFTQEAILETINNYLLSAKRRVTILVPTPADLPMETLKGMPSTRQVQIICDPGDNPDWHKTLGDTGNIQVYHLSPSARVQSLFAVDREAEEIMLAPAEQEFPVGIISKEEPMIKTLTQLLSQARGMATQQQR